MWSLRDRPVFERARSRLSPGPLAISTDRPVRHRFDNRGPASGHGSAAGPMIGCSPSGWRDCRRRTGCSAAKHQRDHGVIPASGAWGHLVQRSRSGRLVGRCSLDDSRDRSGSPPWPGSGGAQGADADAKVPNLHSDPGRRLPRYSRPIDREASSTSPRRIIMRSRLKRAPRAWRSAGWSADGVASHWQRRIATHRHQGHLPRQIRRRR